MESISQRQAKRCSKCRVVQPLAEFHKNRAAYDGYCSYCKSCCKSRSIMPSPSWEAFGEGDKFGSWTVLGPAVKHGRRAYFPCRCKCGDEHFVEYESLVYKRSCSCGCVPNRKNAAKNRTHGEGFHRTSLYRRWSNMHSRCTNPNTGSYHIYGGRGITVCPEWDRYENFRDWSWANGYQDDLRLDLQIDRIDNNAGYSPENCRWVTRLENMQNSRLVVNVTAFGETKSIAAWGRDSRCAVRYDTLKYRLSISKMPPEQAITTPALQYKT